MFPAPLARKPAWVRVSYGTGVAAVLCLWLLPLLGVALTSIRAADEISRGEFWTLPAQVRLANYAEVLGGDMAGFILNSFLIAVPAVVGTIALSAMAGFALAKHKLRGARLLLGIFVAGNLVPNQSLMIPVRELVIHLGLYDSRWALIVFHTAFQTGFGTLFMRNFIRELPDAMLETARIEGASEYRVFWHVVLPMIRPAIAAVAVLIFTFVWNDYFWSLVLVQSDDVRPLTAGLQSLRGMWQTSWHLLSAASIVAAVPPVALFFLMQKHLVAGLTYSANAGARQGGR